MYQHTATSADILAAADTIQTMKDYLLETGYHPAMKAAVAKVDSSRYQPETVALDAPTYARPSVAAIVTQLRTQAGMWPVSYQGGAVFERTGWQAFCEYFNVSTGLIGGAVFVTAYFGCSPIDPLFEFACPVLAFTGTLLGFAALVETVFC